MPKQDTYFVYMHTNKINGKRYIGITGQKTTARRWHNGKGYSQQRRFYNSIISHGWDAFDHEILYEGLTKEEAEAKEAELIKKYGSNDIRYGYNIENGGRVHKLSEEQKEHLRKINTGKRHTEEVKQKMRESHIGLSRAWMTGRKPSASTRAKMSEKRKGPNNPRAKKVYQFDLSGKLVASYEYMGQIKTALGISCTGHISQCCSGKRGKAHGFMWSYTPEEKAPYARLWKGGVIHA